MAESGKVCSRKLTPEDGFVVLAGIWPLAEISNGGGILIAAIHTQVKMPIQQVVEIKRRRSAIPFASGTGDVDVGGKVVCQQVLAGVLRSERESAAGGQSAKLEARPILVKNRPEN